MSQSLHFFYPNLLGVVLSTNAMFKSEMNIQSLSGTTVEV